jgi:hypothetical protein
MEGVRADLLIGRTPLRFPDRNALSWKDVEGSPGQIRWGEVDPIIDVSNSAGLRLLLTITAAPEWARPGGDYRVEGPPQGPAFYAAFVGQVAGRYCDKLSAIEVWNEPNLAREWGNERIDPARYVRLLHLAYRAVKQVCPGMIVVSAGLSPTGVTNAQAMDDYLFLDLAYHAGLRDCSDAIGAHPYGFNNPAGPRGGVRGADVSVEPELSHRCAGERDGDVGDCRPGGSESDMESVAGLCSLEGVAEVMAVDGDGMASLDPAVQSLAHNLRTPLTVVISIGGQRPDGTRRFDALW